MSLSKTTAFHQDRRTPSPSLSDSIPFDTMNVHISQAQVIDSQLLLLKQMSILQHYFSETNDFCPELMVEAVFLVSAAQACEC